MANDPDDWSDPRLAALYDRGEGGRADLDLYETIVSETGARSVIDVGCGTGVLALRLARAGHDVIGIDPSAPMLSIARRQPDADTVRWIRGTAADLPPVEFDLAAMTGNVAQVFLTDDAWSSTLHAIARSVRPGGHLVFETRVPERRAWEQWTPDRTRHRLTAPDGGGVERWCEVLDVTEPLVTFRWTYRFDDGTDASTTSTLRFRTRDELDRSIDEAGFDAAEVRGAPDRPGKEWIFIARRR